MKKILVLLNAGNIPHYVISSSINIAGKTASSICAVFLNDLDTDVEFDYPFPNNLSVTDSRLSKGESDSVHIHRIDREFQVIEAESEKSAFKDAAKYILPMINLLPETYATPLF